MGIIQVATALALTLGGVGLYQARKRLPAGLSREGTPYPTGDCEFLRDLTWIDASGTRQVEQQIFAAVLAMIREARELILLDMFLYNDFTGAAPPALRSLAREVTEALLARKAEVPGLRLVLITDPVNTVYGGLANLYLERLRAAGAQVIVTDLDRLRDSNFLYSPLWRLFIRPLGSGPGRLLPNPFGPGRVSLRSYLRLLNFKANHRKLLVADNGRGYGALVTSANPHDGSSAHGNVALRFSGPAALEVLACEQCIPGVAAGIVPEVTLPARANDPAALPAVQVLTEGAIKRVVLRELRTAGTGDRVDLVMFYLADRQVLRALRGAQQRGARLRVILDPNKDAFGRRKNGIPNRQTAAALSRSGVDVCWANTHGEQLHSKMLLLERAGGTAFLLLGSANFTRRNLDEYNLELDVAFRARPDDRVIVAARRYIDQLWGEEGEVRFSTDYGQYADRSRVRKIVSLLQEVTGMSSF